MNPIEAIQEKWRKEYEKKIPDKLENLKELKSQLKDYETLKAFRMEIHKIAGSAGTAGYTQISEICKEFDQDLQKKLENFKSFDPDWLPEFESKLELIRLHFIHKPLA